MTWFGLVIVYGGVFIKITDSTSSECVFPPKQKVIPKQIDAGHLSTVLTYKCT